MIQLLESMEPFRHLPSETLCRLASVAEEEYYPKAGVIFREGEPADFLWVLKKGWVQLMKRTTDHKSLTLDLVTPKSGLCGLSAFSGQAYLASAVAATPVEAVRLPGGVLRKLLKSQAPFASCVTGIFSQRFHHMAAAYATAFTPLEQRIASVLLRLDENFGTTLPVTRRVLAQLAGTTVESAIRVTNRMRQENLLFMRRGQIVLVNPKGLAKRLGDV